RRQRNGQHPGNAPHGSIQRQLAHRAQALDALLGQLAAGGQDAKGNGEIASRPRLGQVRWSQVYDEPPRGEREARVAESRADPVPAFPHGCVGESDDFKEGQPRADVHLNLHQVALDAVDGAAQDPGEQKETPPTAPEGRGWCLQFPVHRGRPGSFPLANRRSGYSPAQNASWTTCTSIGRPRSSSSTAATSNRTG